MDNTEIHYLTYDPDEIYREMLTAYIEAGGDIIYPGDEKDMLLRGVQMVMVQAFAGIDNALRMSTLRYAAGDYLDLYGEQRGCYRITAAEAEARIRVTFAATGSSGIIPAGTALTADGAAMYVLKEDVTRNGAAGTADAIIMAQQAGAAGNGLSAGTAMQFTAQQTGVVSVAVLTNAAGGNDRETDDAYRERIRTYGLTAVTTGPKAQYEAAAMAVSGEIIDANAALVQAGTVGVYLLLTESADADTIIQAVENALNDENVRPLTDLVMVSEAEAVEYTLNVQYTAQAGINTSEIQSAAEEYRIWQDNTVGRAFNPDRLVAALYQAGASRVIFAAGSEFDGGDVEYTEIEPDEHCAGTITVTQIPEA